MSESCHGRDVASPCDPPDISAKRPENRAGLTALSYRISDHASSVARMLHQLPRQTIFNDQTKQEEQPLRGLTTRTLDDGTISLIDAFGCTLDVLTFYQERIANEGYVRTATERMSLLELARTIDYELRPGVAASASLAFTVESADDSFRVVDVPVGTQIMSIPSEPTDRPQIFETVQPIVARAEWNAIPARTQHPQNIVMWWPSSASATEEQKGRLYLLDLDNSFDLSSMPAADVVTIDSTNVAEFFPVTPGLDLNEVLAGLVEDAKTNPEIQPVIRGLISDETQIRGLGLGLAVGRRILAVASQAGVEDQGPTIKTCAYAIAAVQEDADHQLTIVRLKRIVAQPPPPRPPLQIRFQTALLPVGQLALQPIHFNAVTANTVVHRASWSSANLSAFLKVQAWPRVQLMTLFRQPPPPPVPKLGEAFPGFYALRQKVGFFGNSAPKHQSLAQGDPPAYPKDWDNLTQANPAVPTKIWQDSQGNNLADVHAYLEREVPEIVPDSWVVFENIRSKYEAYRVAGAATQSVADFAISGKATGLLLSAPDGSTHSEPGDFTFRTTSAHVDSQLLQLGGLPIIEAIPAGSTEIMLNGLYLDLQPGMAISIVGERADALGLQDGETCILEDVTHVGGFTRLVAAEGLVYSYKRTSVRVNANVAGATHGERKNDALGSGDATLSNQAFKLSKPPLTFVSAATDSGTQTTLEVRVDGILWRETGSLYEARPDDAVYIVRIDDDGVTRVVFGDGVHGKRLPTGSLNVTASYRTGMGVEGEVAEESLTLLKTRPLGIAGVTNRLAARGAAEAESLGEVRERAPQSVRTLGRIVSLTDYEDFALSFAGIGKARVTDLWRGRSRLVHLTVAPATEGVFSPSDATLTNLADAINRRRDPYFELIVSPHLQRLFQLNARVGHHPRFLAADVEAAIRERLENAFGYQAARLGDSISAASVISIIQGTAGVVYVDLNELRNYDGGQPPTATNLASVLGGRIARFAAPPDDNEIDAAELMTLFPAGVSLLMEQADV